MQLGTERVNVSDFYVSRCCRLSQTLKMLTLLLLVKWHCLGFCIYILDKLLNGWNIFKIHVLLSSFSSGCLLAIEGIPLHFTFFSKLWMEIYQKSSDVRNTCWTIYNNTTYLPFKQCHSIKIRTKFLREFIISIMGRE